MKLPQTCPFGRNFCLQEIHLRQKIGHCWCNEMRADWDWQQKTRKRLGEVGAPPHVKEPETSMPAVHWAGLGTSMEDTCSHPENMPPMFMPPKGKPPPLKGLSLCIMHIMLLRSWMMSMFHCRSVALQPEGWGLRPSLVCLKTCWAPPFPSCPHRLACMGLQSLLKVLSRTICRGINPKNGINHAWLSLEV